MGTAKRSSCLLDGFCCKEESATILLVMTPVRGAVGRKKLRDQKESKQEGAGTLLAGGLLNF